MLEFDVGEFDFFRDSKESENEVRRLVRCMPKACSSVESDVE